MRSMIFTTVLWYKALSILFLLIAIGAITAAINSWHIDSMRELYYLYTMSVIFLVAGVYNSFVAFKYKLIISDNTIKEINAFKRNKCIKIDDILKVVIFRRTARLNIITKDDVIVVKDNLGYYITFFRVLKQSIPRDKLFFFDKKCLCS